MSVQVDDRPDTTDEHADVASPAEPARGGVRPRHVVIAIGLVFAVLTAGSGLASLLWERHDDSEISREVLGNIPGPLRLALYTLLPILLLYGAVAFANRVRNWERGRPDRRPTNAKNVKRRLADFRAGVYMQTLLREPAAGIMHSLIYFNFLILMGVTTVLEINHQAPESL